MNKKFFTILMVIILFQSVSGYAQSLPPAGENFNDKMLHTHCRELSKMWTFSGGGVELKEKIVEAIESHFQVADNIASSFFKKKYLPTLNSEEKGIIASNIFEGCLQTWGDLGEEKKGEILEKRTESVFFMFEYIDWHLNKK